MRKAERIRAERAAANRRAMRQIILALLHGAHDRLDYAEGHFRDHMLYEARQDCGDVLEMVQTAYDQLSALHAEERDIERSNGRATTRERDDLPPPRKVSRRAPPGTADI